VDSADNVFVADTGNNAIKVLPAGFGQTGPAVTIAAGFFLSPQGVVTDTLGNIFVADTGDNSVKMIRYNDYAAFPIGLGQGFSNPTAVSVDTNGRLYVIDANGVWMLTP
jgi:streptogramin lyase